MTDMMYSGLCIGGPEDGKFRTYECPVFTVPILSKPDARSANIEVGLTPVLAQKIRYRHVPIYMHETKDTKLTYHLWVVEDMSISAAFNRLINNYTNKPKDTKHDDTYTT